MGARTESEPTPMKNRTTVERQSERELVVTRTFNGPARIIFDAWTKPELLKRWWAPKSLGVTLFSCDADVRVGGSYRFVFGRDPKQPMAFSGIYKEVTPFSRLVWTQLFEQMPRCGRGHHDCDARGKGRQDPHGRPPILRVEGVCRRCDRLGDGEGHARDVRAAGDARRVRQLMVRLGRPRRVLRAAPVLLRRGVNDSSERTCAEGLFRPVAPAVRTTNRSVVRRRTCAVLRRQGTAELRRTRGPPGPSARVAPWHGVAHPRRCAGSRLGPP